MKKAAMAIVVGFAGMAARADRAPQPMEHKVILCVQDTVGFLTPQAEAMASKMFGGIGLLTEWYGLRRGCPGQAIQLSITSETPNTLMPGALAYALPYEGTHIRVFYDRIVAGREPALARALLAHVLVHEITHILQGVSCHSVEGVMKARWDGEDLSRMAREPLLFSEVDILLIHLGLDGRTARAMTAGNKTPATIAVE